MAINRRDFLRRSSCAAISAAAFGSSVEQFGLINVFAQQPEAVADYKALVCIFLDGGNDGNNMIVPLDDYANYATASGREVAGLALPQSVLLPITASGRQLGFHPNLSPEVANVGQAKGLLDVWNQNKLAIVANVGNLVQPITKQQYQQNIGRPYQLFSHSDQVAEQQTAVANSPVQTGWGGLVADRTQSINGGAPLPMIISISGSSLFGTGRLSKQLTVAPAPTSLDSLLTLSMTNDAGSARRATFDLLRGFDRGLSLVKASSDTTTQALIADAALMPPDPTIATLFPNTSLGNQLKQVAKLIKANLTLPVLGLSRQIFFCRIGGFDTHGNQTGTNPTSPASGGAASGAQGGLLAQLSQAMKAFYDFTTNVNNDLPGMASIAGQVTQFTLSDFGRTLQASGSGAATVGSDHAWGSHLLVLGGAVLGGSMYGTYPTLAMGGPSDTDTRGRWIPTTSIDQYAATLARWYGLSSSDIPIVFPYVSRFATSNLGFLP
jgi:uncharacterized protein (DUF1501 family)